MAKSYPAIDEALTQFIRRQHVFFVATAPLSAAGHINLSPKGLDSFAVVGPTTVAYLDLTGSGVETMAHVRENGRIVILFCAFEGPPKILRLHGRAEALEPGEESFASLYALFAPRPAVRSIVRIELDRITDSCGYGVPLYTFAGERTQLAEWAERKGEEGVRAYREEHNRTSIDGLPGLRSR